MRISVDLPQPDGPITQMNSRRCTSKVMSCSAVIGPALDWKVFSSASISNTTGRSRIRRNRSATSGAISR